MFFFVTFPIYLELFEISRFKSPLMATLTQIQGGIWWGEIFRGGAILWGAVFRSPVNIKPIILSKDDFFKNKNKINIVQIKSINFIWRVFLQL